ncbi:RDD domain containing protein [Janibacter hoylei PVAS-1]|uniref:RDD domain containing protein n=1 Tax=Janibacter hoylei PVAS-1 TaxID=1210046 RepID=K1DXN5_9MICO|nr:RDD family protein [Janibacter hoylei]EKA61154.1 RDD domain containing protein [Janibacter hoylei PVAS-1]RWU82694.1 RDD family protein [Janibacter hoylei PVAS-1]
MSIPTPPPPPTTGSDPDRPGSRAWVEQRYGRTAAFADRIVPGIIDGLLSTAAAFVPLVLGIICIAAGVPDTYDCGGYYYSDTCEVPGSGSGLLIFVGILCFLLTFVASLAMVAWNRVWRVTKTGQSIGKKVTGLKVIDATTGQHPQLGAMALRELVHQFAGIISWIWMLVDDDDRTLADIVGKTHVVHADRG